MTIREAAGRAEFAFIESRAKARTPTYQPGRERIAASQMTAFSRALQAHTGQCFADEQALHDFSVREFRVFWRFLVHWTLGPRGYSGDRQPVCEGDDIEHATFFPRLRLNYAQCLLAMDVAGPGAPALTACHADGRRLRWTRAELRDQVEHFARALSGMGVREGDRVVGVMRNDGAAVIAALAVTALGATLSTAAPEMGADAVLDRFARLAPGLLLAHIAPRDFDTGQPLAERVARLAAGLPSLRDIVCLDDGRLPADAGPRVHGMAELIAQGSTQGIVQAGTAAFEWRRFPFNHPLFIMFSSGTTGRPKCIVHGAGGSLLEHLKEHRLHTDLRCGDRLYFHTGCGWMMWNWQLSALASGAEIVTFDGPVSTVDRLWRLVADERITVFGTSPAYLAMCEEAGLVPGRQLDLPALRAVLSTGAVLHDRQFHWVRSQVKNVPVQSISGGTDILGCFVLGHPNLPVHAGEAQCKSLALGVQAWKDGGPTGGIGDLVCVNPFPSRPLGFFGDTDGSAFHAAYFARNPGVWTHGDLIGLAPDGGARLHGRTDGVLNVRGIKIAPEEILRVVRGVPGIREAMVVEQPGSEPRIVLLLVLRRNAVLDADLVWHLRRELAHRLSAAHVPDVVVAVDELPVTHSGKISEAAARAALGDAPVCNAGALRNPACLEAIRCQVALHGEQARRPTAAGPTQQAQAPQMQQKLQALWQEKFGFGPVAPDDNFFELGGNSLLAARILADAGRLAGRVLPLSTLLVAPTVRQMAALLDGVAPPPGRTGPVPIRAGVGAPVFMVHGLSGSVMECWRLVHALRTPRPVYGLQAPGLDGGRAPGRRVEEIAADYVDKLRAVQSSGPYALVGYSFGGLVALEMGEQLWQQGERCDMLCLLDTYAQQDLPWTAWVRHRWERAVRKTREFTAPQLLGYAAGKLAALARDALPRMAVRQPPQAQPQFLHESMSAALRGYRPRPYHGGVLTYVRAAVRLGDYYDPLPLWRSVACGGIAVVPVPGGHLEMLGPHVRSVAGAIDAALGCVD